MYLFVRRIVRVASIGISVNCIISRSLYPVTTLLMIQELKKA
jgi:hypothetical protein